MDTPPQVPPEVTPQSKIKPFIAVVVFLVLVVGAGALYVLSKKTSKGDRTDSLVGNAPVVFKEALVNIPFVRQEIRIDPSISKDFSLDEIKNIPDMEKAYGFTFSAEELAKLQKNKFVVKNLLDTTIVGEGGLPVDSNTREIVALYKKIAGAGDYKSRTQANAVFISSDAMLNLFSILSTDLLKETENTHLYGQTFSMTKVMYEEAVKNLAQASTDEERAKWTKIRDYFAVPYALLSTVVKPVNAENYWQNESGKANGMSVEEAQADYAVKDKDADSEQKVTAFVKNLNLGGTSEKAVLADLKQIRDASDSRGTPTIFAEEMRNLPPAILVKIPFTLFKPRGTYTSSSLRRQYFRAIQWYQQIPFLLASKELTSYATAIGQVVHDNPDVQVQYKSFSSFIAFIVGESDDLDVSDYFAAVTDLGSDAVQDQMTLRKFLDARKPDAKIKSLPVDIDPTAKVKVEDEIAAMRGMRFMSQKFIPDSYWTSKLTQGYEAPAVRGLKLPDQASMIEVMAILGSPYATSHLTDLPFYATYKDAVDTRLEELKTESHGWSDKYWQSNLYTSSLWTTSGLFEWQHENKASLPQFMQSTQWDAKTLLTGAGFWTELRHMAILYAKQSFAEKGGGGDDACDLRKVPEAPKGYVEPQAESYDRLYYAAKRLDAEYKVRDFKLKNLPKLETYIGLLNTIREYSKLELENTAFSESVITKTRHSSDENKDCVEYFLDPADKITREGEGYPSYVTQSRWEELRWNLIGQMVNSLPYPVEGPVIEIKDKRAALVADIHTDKNGGILEEGTGVPRVIFVAVKDTNGARLTVGFTYSQYETISDERLTDEQWQDNFYKNDKGDVDDYFITYKPKNTWPDTNTWFRELLGSK